MLCQGKGLPPTTKELALLSSWTWEGILTPPQLPTLSHLFTPAGGVQRDGRLLHL